MLIASALLALALVAAPNARAESAYSDDRVAFGGINGVTVAVQAVGDQVWVGGEFTQAVDADLSTTHARNNLAVFDFNTGDVLPMVADANSKVEAIETDDTSTVWVGGNFSEIAGEQQAYIAAFDAVTGELDTTFDVSLNFSVYALHYNDGWLYIGGDFGEVNGLSSNKMARVDAVTGEVDTSFNAHPSGTVRSIDTYDDRVYVSGLFEMVGTGANTVARRWVAGFDSSTGVPAGPEFAVPPLSGNEGTHKAGFRRALVSPDGNFLYTADNRNFITQWDRLTGEKIWDLEAEGDIQAVVTEGETVYLGTHDGFLEKNDERLLFALNVADGSVDNEFAPLQNSYMGTLELELAQGALIAVGDFTTVNGVSSPRLAVFHGPDWNGATPLNGPPPTPTPEPTPTPDPALPGDVNCDGLLNVADSLVIAQYSAGLRTQSAACPLADAATEIGPGADVNNNGVINVADALLVAQCTVGVPNAACPL